MQTDAVNILNEETVHSKNIRSMFNGDVSYNSRAPLFASPFVVLLFTNRSGSNLAAQYLTGTGYIGGLLESTNYPSVAARKEKSGSSSFSDLFSNEASKVIDSGRVFGIKASPNQLATLLRWNILSMFPDVKLLHSVRRNVIEQAVSLSIANQTKQWTSEMEAKNTDVVFEFDDISKHIQRICHQNAAACLMSSILNTNLHPIVYEELTADPRTNTLAALDFLGLQISGIHIKKPTLQKQANEMNKRFIERYQTELRNLVGSNMNFVGA